MKGVKLLANIHAVILCLHIIAYTVALKVRRNH